MARWTLLVDDDIAEISAVKRVLQNAGLQPTLATNGTDALGAIEEAAPDLIVLAPSCENGGGAALAGDLAARDETRHIPLILLGAGVEGVPAQLVARPIEAEALQNAIEEALGRSTSSVQPSQPRYASEVAALERAAAEQEAIRELRRAGDVPPAGEPHERCEPQESSPSELLEGSLAAVSMPRWLAMAAGARATGRLEVTCDPTRWLWLELGRVVGADSAAPSERAEEVALRLGLVTREQHRDTLPSVAGLASRRVGALLLERGCLRPAELALLARRRAEEIAFALFTSDAQYRFEPAERVPPDERAALERGALALALEGVRRRWPADRVDAVLGGTASLLAPAAHPPAGDLGLSAEERRVAQLADGLRTLDEILAGTPLDALSSRQILAGLVEVGALEVKVRAPLQAEGHAGRPGAIDLLRMREKLEQVRRADYFTILGLGRGCTTYEVREASERLLSELAVERFDPAAPGVAAEVREIRRVVEDARDVLADDAVRAEYLARLEE